MVRFASTLLGAVARVRGSVPARGYAAALPFVLIAAALEALLLPEPALAPFVLFQLAVGLAAWAGGIGPGLLAVALSALVANAAFLDAPRAGAAREPALAATAVFGVGGATLAVLVATLRGALRRADASTAAARRQAATAERLADALGEAGRRKDDLLVRLSHELRNPLAPIASTVTVLSRAPAGSPAAVRAVNVLGRQVKQLSRLVDDLLDADQLRRGGLGLRRARVDLAALVRDTVEDHRGPCASQGVAIDHVGADAAAWVDGDAARLVQVLGNLLDNARKFTPSGGRVEVALSRADGRAVVHVRDTGSGIAPEALADLFEPFAQGAQGLDRARGGLGLGLSIVKRLVELHGGDVAAASEGAGRGAELTFRLPIDPRDAPPELAVRAAS